MLKRCAAIALFVAFAIPATSFAIPSITASPGSIVEGAGVAVELFFNVFPGDVVTAGDAQVDGTGLGTSFTGSANFSVNGGTTVGGVNNPGPGGLATAGWTFGPNCGNAGCAIAPGAHQFATLTISTLVGDAGSGLVLVAGNFVQAPFCNGAVSNSGQTLVSITPVPEPTAVVLIGGALAGLAFLRRRSS